MSVADADRSFDAIAVGGGLAGAVFATVLAERGARVLLLERTREPTLKVCGDFLSAEAIGLLDGVGIDTGAMGATSVERASFVSGARAAEVTLPFTAAGLSRLILDEALLLRAAEAGAIIERGVTVGGLAPDGDGHVVVEAGGRRFRAPAVALATGKHNLRGWPRDQGSVTAFKMQFELGAAARADLAGRVRMVLFDGGYLGACLVEGDRATLCWQLDRAALSRFGADWRGQLDGIAAGSNLLGDLLLGAVPLSGRPAAVAGLPFGYLRSGGIARGVYPIGDQLAVIPPFTGDGTSIALASGIQAAQAVADGIPAMAFQHAFIRGLRRQFFVARSVAAVFRSARLRQVAVGALDMLPAAGSMIARGTRLGGESAARLTSRV
ncbi:MAG: FAD-dependent monooxygenase [Bauldia sp.]|nr:FAD-dependent monooxygenase [Bauldia sp.]